MIENLQVLADDLYRDIFPERDRSLPGNRILVTAEPGGLIRLSTFGRSETYSRNTDLAEELAAWVGQLHLNSLP